MFSKTLKTSVLVIAAHPDDEILGCGGTIARHHKSGDSVAVLVMADGISSRNASHRKSLVKDIEYRRQSAQRANEILGINKLTFLSYPDNRMDSVALLDIVRDIENELDKLKPSIIYTHHAGDVNIDHSIVHEAAIVACRPQPGHSVKQLLFFETPSSTEWRPAASRSSFEPNWFVDISETLDLKLQALAAYSSELRDFPHPRSLAAIEHLARWRGASVGLEAAEAFELGRYIL
jgi:LmbE family N-acetylglucosaminyl deacetylase